METQNKSPIVAAKKFQWVWLFQCLGVLREAEQTTVGANTRGGAAEAEMLPVPDALYNWPVGFLPVAFIVGQHVGHGFESDRVLGQRCKTFHGQRHPFMRVNAV